MHERTADTLISSNDKRRQHRDNEEHSAAEHEPVDPEAEPVDREDLNSEQESAHQEDKVGGGYGEAIGDAEKIHAGDGDGDCDPVAGRQGMLKEDLPDRDEHDIQRRNKAGLTGGRTHIDRELLKICGGEERRATDKTANDYIASGADLGPPAQQADDKQNQKGDDRTQSRYRERPEILRAHALSGESGSPDYRSEQRVQ